MGGKVLAARSSRTTSLFPALSGRRGFKSTVLSWRTSVGQHRAQRVGLHAIIFCGHFPDGAQMFTEDEIEGESRGAWYARQVAGSANLTGSKLLHLLSGNLSHQIEHHAFPDLPSNRYGEVAPRVQALCERAGLPYTQGSLPKQFGSVVRRIVRLSLPNR